MGPRLRELAPASRKRDHATQGLLFLRSTVPGIAHEHERQSAEEEEGEEDEEDDEDGAAHVVLERRRLHAQVVGVERRTEETIHRQVEIESSVALEYCESAFRFQPELPQILKTGRAAFPLKLFAALGKS